MSDSAQLIPKPPKRNPPTREDFKGVKISGDEKVLHLQLYHVLFNTKKLSKKTLRRMKRKQSIVNKRKRNKHIVKGPEELEAKAERSVWLSKANKIAKEMAEQKQERKRRYEKRKLINKRRCRGGPRRDYRRQTVRRQEEKKKIQLATIKVENHPLSGKYDKEEQPVVTRKEGEKSEVEGYNNDQVFPSLL